MYVGLVFGSGDLVSRLIMGLALGSDLHLRERIMHWGLGFRVQGLGDGRHPHSNPITSMGPGSWDLCILHT